MQGRLSEQVDGKIQAFPWESWKDEFFLADKIELRLMEWTIDQHRLYENPLMTFDGQKLIYTLCRKYDVSVQSLTGDCFMQLPFWKSFGKVEKKLQEDFLAVCRACSKLSIKMIIVPLVDNGSLENTKQEDKLIKFLLSHQLLFISLNLKIVFEFDYKPLGVKNFIDKLPRHIFGVNYDIGNSAANGFDPAEEFEVYGSRVLNVHVKDRVLGGATVALLKGNADFELVFSKLKKIKYCGNFILQTARSENKTHTDQILKYHNMVLSWLSLDFQTFNKQ